MIGLSDKTAPNIEVLKKTYSIGGKNINFETGKMGLLADGSVTISDDIGNVLFVTATLKQEGVNEEASFFPLVVDYQEKFYATGKIGGNRFMKREGRPSESSTLTSRLIDRPIRPMFPKGFVNDTQVIATALSASNESDLGFLGITGASISLMMSGCPFEGPVSGVRIIKTNSGEFIFDPTFEQEQDAVLNLLVAGTLDAITMVESTGKEVSDSEMIEGLKYSHEIIKDFCNAQIDFIKKYEEKYSIPEFVSVIQSNDESEYSRVCEFLTEEKMDSLYDLGKKEFSKQIKFLEEELTNYIGYDLENEDEVQKSKNIPNLVSKRVKEVMRKNILLKEKRLDLRGVDEVRQIKCETGLLPRVHGSALFQRGMTQALSITTLGGPSDIQIVDDMYEETTRRYIHHYNFPPFSVGEVRMMRGIGRREVGHDKLAERALEAVLPSEEKFPYMIRVVSETMTCNGSSSMASICGSTLSLMQAGVPISAPVSGVAMGMIYDEDTGKYKILTDIQAQEDFLGDMDFKVGMTPNGITAMQLDVKIQGLNMEVFVEAFKKARTANNTILENMLSIQPKVAEKLSPYAPLIMSIQVPVEKIREVIGKGGENVQRMEKEYDLKVSIAEDGLTTITARDQVGGQKAIEEIKQMIWEPTVGLEASGKIVKIIDGTGVLVEFRGKTGMIHISKLSPVRVAKIEDVVKLGDIVEFEVIEINKEKGRIGLKRKPSKEELEKLEESKKS